MATSSENISASSPESSARTKPSTLPVSNPLTISEVQSLRDDARQKAAFFEEAFATERAAADQARPNTAT